MVLENDGQRNAKAEESFDEHWDSSNWKNENKHNCVGVGLVGFWVFFT